MHIVVCEDGAIRHASPFDTSSMARHFAEWGHCCTADHVIFYIDFSGSATTTKFVVNKSQIGDVVQRCRVARWITASELLEGDLILLPFQRTALVHGITAVGAHSIRFTTEQGQFDLRNMTKVCVERRN